MFSSLFSEFIAHVLWMIMSGLVLDSIITLSAWVLNLELSLVWFNLHVTGYYIYEYSWIIGVLSRHVIVKLNPAALMSTQTWCDTLTRSLAWRQFVWILANMKSAQNKHNNKCLHVSGKAYLFLFAIFNNYKALSWLSHYRFIPCQFNQRFPAICSIFFFLKKDKHV